MRKKIIGILITMLFIISAFVVNISGKTNFGKTIYVDDDSECPGYGTLESPYCKIQYAIDNASEDDTIFVFNGTYIENVEIDKTINLIGDDRETTIIDGNLEGNVVYVTANCVNISGFTIKKSGSVEYWAGIKIYSNYNIISNNKIGPENYFGISIEGASNNNINKNHISNSSGDGIHLGASDNNMINSNIIESNNWDGIWLNKSSNNDILNNTIEYNGQSGIHIDYQSQNNNILAKNEIIGSNYGIFIERYSTKNNITNNIITSSDRNGIRLSETNNNEISKNHIENCLYSINLEYSSKNRIIKNNLMAKETINIRYNTRLANSFRNYWNGNFWNDYPSDRPPKIIRGKWYIRQLFTIPILNFDWDPQIEPYDLP